MARPKSTIMTPAEKRSAGALLKKDIKIAEGNIKAITKEIASLVKDHEKTFKALEKAKDKASAELQKLDEKLQAITASEE